MPELAVNCLEHLVGTSFTTCYFSHLMEILFHHEGSQAWENFSWGGHVIPNPEGFENLTE